MSGSYMLLSLQIHNDQIICRIYACCSICSLPRLALVIIYIPCCYGNGRWHITDIHLIKIQHDMNHVQSVYISDIHLLTMIYILHIIATYIYCSSCSSYRRATIQTVVSSCNYKYSHSGELQCLNIFHSRPLPL